MTAAQRHALHTVDLDPAPFNSPGGHVTDVGPSGRSESVLASALPRKDEAESR